MSKPNSLAPLFAIAERAHCHFTDSDGQAFAKFPAGSGFTILPVRSPEYRDWFFASYYGDHSTIPSAPAFRALLLHLEAQADADINRRRFSVYRRVGARGPNPIPNQILLDLANPRGEFVEISPSGWCTTTAMNVNFETCRAVEPLPAPQRAPQDGPQNALDLLPSLLNFATRADWLRCLVWILSALRPPSVPCPILLLQGPPSSGKSLAARILRYLIDPAALTPIPSSVRQLHTFANQNWILAFDHVSRLSPPLCDALCRLSTGAGIALPSSTESATQPILQCCRRPIVLTVTSRFTCPEDLAERSLAVNLSPLPPDRRRPELDFQTAFLAARPQILATLCDALSTALRSLPTLSPITGPHPDALAWAIAAAPSLNCTESELRESLLSPTSPVPGPSERSEPLPQPPTPNPPAP